jgi:dienelactone hydrolase
MTAHLIDGFEPPRPVRYGNIERQLYVSSRGAVPLVVLHELPGMSPSFIKYCARMVEEDFKVYMPLLFMKPNDEAKSKLAFFRLCLRKEFYQLFLPKLGTSPARPFTMWMLNLIREVREENPDQKIGVVGMCLTGGFALAAIADSGVHASIACQPSVPFIFNISTLGLSNEEREMASRRARTLPKPCAKGYRYAGDSISKDAHMKAASDLLGDAFERYPDLNGMGHSTLTADEWSKRKEWDPGVFDDVLAFLDARLK